MSSSNIKSVTKTADASAVVGRSRLLGVYFTNGTVASSFSLKDGTTTGGAAKLVINTPAAAGSQNVRISDTGILFETGIFVDVADAQVLSVTLLFEGGAPA